MASCHGNLSPSHPMESVCRHFPPPPLLYLVVYFLRLSWANTRRVRWPLAMVTRLHRIQWSPFADISLLSPFYFAVYIANPIYSRRGNPSPSDPIESSRLPTCISTRSATIYFAVYSLSLANWLSVSLVVHGLRPSDSVWVYWTILASGVS